jgi:hypothetical protein
VLPCSVQQQRRRQAHDRPQQCLSAAALLQHCAPYGIWQLMPTLTPAPPPPPTHSQSAGRQAAKIHADRCVSLGVARQWGHAVHVPTHAGLDKFDAALGMSMKLPACLTPAWLPAYHALGCPVPCQTPPQPGAPTPSKRHASRQAGAASKLRTQMRRRQCLMGRHRCLST